ncbi:hypothetical protein [Nocardia testacea]|uniref:Uncharacterized protein n=1 Tax=Nocardia testacea TaxID=248551 RepID=A0ABW7VR85_9NOCA
MPTLLNERVRQLKTPLSAAIRAGEIGIDSLSNEMLARCAIGLGRHPENHRARSRPRASQCHLRDTAL